MDGRDQMKLFGINLFQREIDKENKNPPKTFAPERNEDGATVVEQEGYQSMAGGFAGNAWAIDIAGSLKNEIELIKKYRKMSINHEADEAIDDICNEAIVQLDRQPIVEVDLEPIDKSKLSDNVKETIKNEFHEIIKMLDFEDKGYNIFRQWYIDGRLYYHKIIHDDKSRGIRTLKRIDPLQLKKVREIHKKTNPENPNMKEVDKIDEYYVFNEKGIDGDVGPMGLRIAPEAITFAHSGMVDEHGKIIISHLHKAIRPMNQLRMIEDASVIYRISRAPERRIFYIDVGNLPTIKAEQYVADIMNRYKNRLVYDASSGDVKSDRRHMHMLEDFYLPRREGGKGTEIDTLPGGQNLDQIEDIKYFQRLFYKSLNVPLSRLEPEMNTSLSRGIEITRDELKFKKFIKRVQRQFAMLFLDLLETQLILKRVISQNEWKTVKEEIDFVWAEDSYFVEAKTAELIRDRMEILGQIGEHVGTYYSKEYIRKNVLYQTEEEIKKIDEQIKAEAAAEAGDSPETASYDGGESGSGGKDTVSYSGDESGEGGSETQSYDGSEGGSSRDTIDYDGSENR